MESERNVFESVLIPAADPSWSITADATQNKASEHPVAHQSEMTGKRKLAAAAEWRR